MDEMKHRSEIDDALHEIAKQRDKLLSKAPTLSPARRAVLTDFLVGGFPIEAALREAATKRDQLLKHPPEIPASAESILRRELVAAGAARDAVRGRRASDRVARAQVWLRLFRSPLSAGLTGCALITAAILCFSRWGTPSHRNAENLGHTEPPDGVSIESAMILDRSPMGRAELFTRQASIHGFNLNTNEPASLQASFFANRGLYFADGNNARLGLRLDLPVRAILMEDLARTP